MKYLGFSTGCLHKTRYSLNERIELYHLAGANALEIGLASIEELQDFNLTSKLAQNIKKFDYLSIHVPWGMKYNSDLQTKLVIEKLKVLCALLPIDGIVIHPDLIEDFSVLERSGLPFLMENENNAREKFGQKPEDFEKLASDYDFGFVFDTQHAFECNQNISYSRKLLEIMGDRLRHMHVSGCTEDKSHSPVHLSDNKEQILKILKIKKDLPKISGGVIVKNVHNKMMVELGLLNKK